MSKYEVVTRATDFSRKIIEKYSKDALVAVDATMGNGHDTLKLAQNLMPNSKLYAFDIQEEAIVKTREKLINSDLSCDNYELICDGHQNLDEYINEAISFAIFNLGYLPGGDHEKTTKWSTTKEAISKVLKKLDGNGLLAIVVYPGHEAGSEEATGLTSYLSNLDQIDFSVMKLEVINQINEPPFVYLIERGNQ